MPTSVKKNYFYNLSYQLFLIISPLITSPYIARVFGPSNIGLISYISTFVDYFLLFGKLSIDLFGTRELSYVRENLKEKSERFWELFFVVVINASIVMLVFFVIIFFKRPKYMGYYLIQSITFLSSIFDITWLFSSHENFKIIALRNFLTRTISIVSIFIFIRSSNDMWKYILINTLTPLFSNLLLWIRIKNYIVFVKPRIKRALKYLPGMFKVFLPTIAISVYTMLDKLMLGVMSQPEQLGYYEYSQRIVRMALTVVTSITPVMLVKMSASYKSEITELSKWFYKSLKFAVFASSFLFLMLFSITPEFIPWFYGEKFLPAVTIIQVLSPIVIAISLGTTAGHQFLLSIGKESLLSLALFLGAAENFILNLILIPRYKALGASLASVIAEATITITLYLIVSRFIEIRGVLIRNLKFILFAILIIPLLRCIGSFMEASVVTNLTQVIVGSFTYGIMSLSFDKQIRGFLLQTINRIIGTSCISKK